MSKKLFGVVIFVALICSGAYYIYKKNTNSENVPLVLYGNVDIRDVSLGFRVFGRIDKLNFDEGDRVKKGDVLALLDKKPFEDDVAVKKAQVSELEILIANAQSVFERKKTLIDTGGVSQNDYDAALTQLKQLKAKLVSTQAQLEQSITKESDTSLAAPSDGVVLTRVKERGSIVGEGVAVYTMALDNPVWVRAYVNEKNLGHVHVGQKATVTTDSGGKYVATVGFISPQAEFTPKNVETTELRTDLVYRVRVIADKPDSGLRQGMPVTVVLGK